MKHGIINEVKISISLEKNATSNIRFSGQNWKYKAITCLCFTETKQLFV